MRWLGAAAMLLLAAGFARAEERIMVTLGTATPGGGFPVYGQAVAETINGVDPALEVKTRNTKGSTENVPLLEAGQLDLALVQGEVAHEAIAGIGRPPARLLILAAMYTTPGMFVTRGDQPYRAIGDLKGKAVAWGARGSGLVVLARYVLDGIGLDMERDFQSIYLDQAGDGPAMVMDGRAAALWGGGSGWPGFTAVARGPQGARFIAPSAEERARIQTKHAFLKTLTIPAGAYPGQSEPDRLRRLVELHPRPARRARGDGVPSRAGAPPGRGRARRAPAPGQGDDRGQHRCRRTAPRPDPPGSAALFQGDRTHTLEEVHP